ncbi:hypothetical protein F5887DRAFT_1079147 [Amanita rubescens]|nr:hypothetical protein F5887DRAFT_1079147 [Amanita rubescens]
MYPDSPHPVAQQEFATDANGVNYSRYGLNAPWVPICPQLLPAGGGGLNVSLPSFRDTFATTNGGIPGCPPFSENGWPQADPPALPSSSAPPVRDHALANPIPDNDSFNLPPHHKILPTVAQPSPKTAGSRRPLPDKAHGKQRATDTGAIALKNLKRKGGPSLPLSQPDAKRPRHGGRATGAANYSAEDVEALLNILETELPLGGHAWNSAADDFNNWAADNGRPSRTVKSLELKFKQLVKTLKPTGDAECPPHIQRAHQIDDLMNDKAGSRDLDDADIIDVDNDNHEESDDELPTTQRVSKVKSETAPGPVARRVASDKLSTSTTTGSRNTSRNLLTGIQEALTPSARNARDEGHSVTLLQSQQMFTLSSQLREAHRQLDVMRRELAQAERQCNKAERRADRAEMMNMIRSSRRRSRSSAHSPRSRRPQYRHDVHYGDGGHSVQWAHSDDGDLGRNDSPGTRRIVTAVTDSEEERQTASSSTSTNSKATSDKPLAASQLSFEV